jgi:DNA-binding transcriptional LysR family regulator
MELEGIQVFVKVVQAGSFTQAARQLSMPNATVSAKVARLEKRLGVTLIQRTTRKLHVTPAGQAYFEHCVRALEEIQAGETQLASSAKEPQGTLRITASPDMAHSYLPPLVRQYLKKYPLTAVDLIVTNRVVDLVAEGVDIAIRAGELEDSTLMARKFISAGGGMWASPQYIKRKGTPKNPSELEQHDCLLFSELFGNALQLTDGKEHVSIKIRGRLSADDLETLRVFVTAGEGIGMLPTFLCEDPAHRGSLVRVLPKWSWEGGSFSLVYPAQRFVSPKVQAFLELATGRS